MTRKDDMKQVGWAYRAVHAAKARGPWLFAFRVPLPSDTAGNTYTVEVCPIYAPADVDGFMPPRPMPGHDTTWNHVKRANSVSAVSAGSLDSDGD